MTTIERIEDTNGAERWLALASTCVPVDHPGLAAGSLDEILHQLRGTQKFARYAHFLAIDDGVDVAYGTVRLPLRDNLSNATVSMSVLPSRRRQGIGTALATEIVAFIRSSNRMSAIWTVGSPLANDAPGLAFSRMLGAKRVLTRLRRELDLALVDDSDLTTLEVTGIGDRAAAYEIVTWIDRAPAPLVEGVARLVGRMSMDTPRGDLTWESESWDTSRWREKEDDAFQAGRGRVAAGAVDGGGQLVAFTDIGVWKQEPSVAEQWNTIVDPDHRGHRLGLAMKISNIRQLLHDVPGARRLETWNANANSRMIAINELLGFHVVERVDEFQLTL